MILLHLLLVFPHCFLIQRISKKRLLSLVHPLAGSSFWACHMLTMCLLTKLNVREIEDGGKNFFNVRGC